MSHLHIHLRRQLQTSSKREKSRKTNKKSNVCHSEMGNHRNQRVPAEEIKSKH